MYIRVIDDVIQNPVYTVTQLVKDHPTISFPYNPSEKLLNSYGVFKVEPAPQPDIPEGHVCQEGLPFFDNGKWVQSWWVREETKEEIKIKNDAQEHRIRNERNAKLAKIDSIPAVRWSTITEDNRRLWLIYREELLNIPQQAGFPWEVNWPDEPPL